MVVRAGVIAVWMVLCVVAAGCVESSSPGAAPTPGPLLQSTGWLVYLRGQDLYVGDLVSGREQQLTTGSLGAGYAGYARIDGKIWLYYTTATDRHDQPDDGVSYGSALFTVHRHQLGSGDEQTLFAFRDDFRGYGFSALEKTRATVSPDGRFVAHTDAAGIQLYELLTRNERSLVANEPFAGPSNSYQNGVLYQLPEWSPEGDRLAATRSGYGLHTVEQAHAALVDAIIGQVESVEGRGGGFRAWRSDGQALCASDHVYADGRLPNSVFLLSSDGTQLREIAASEYAGTSDDPHPYGCAWSRDGRLAIFYGTFSGAKEEGGPRVSILDAAGVRTDVLTAGGADHVPLWLPDNSGVCDRDHRPWRSADAFERGAHARRHVPTAPVHCGARARHDPIRLTSDD